MIQHKKKVVYAFLLFLILNLANALVPFGVSSSAQSTGTYNSWMPLIKQAGFGTARLFPSWDNIEPKRGTWDWTATDALVKGAASAGITVSGLFFYNVPWLNSNTHTFPNDYNEWGLYVSALVNHTKNTVMYWEVWNEPQSFASGGSVTEYAAIAKRAYIETKAISPNVQVALTVAANDVNYLKQAIVEGAIDHFDYVSVHPYEITAAIQNGWDPVFMGVARTIRRMLTATNPSRAKADIWFTELGLESDGSASGDAEQARTALKAFTMGVAQGVTCINWYEAKDGQGGFGLLKSDGSQRPAYVALKNLITYVGTAPNYLGWVQINANKDYGFVFEGPTTPVLVLWLVFGETDNVQFSGKVRVVNPVMGSITPLNAGSSLTPTKDPVLVLDVPSDIVTQAKNNKNSPFPWGGDFTKAKTITSIMGVTNTDSGLHQFNPNVSSTPVTVYGGPARDCGKGGSQDFTVDPNFLSYDPEEIVITAITRRKENNQNAGFNLWYEGPDGWKNTGSWYTVPGNDKWYTNTWTISDPQFVSIWGFNFRLNSDSTSNSQYYLQSVNVTKV